MRVFIYNIVGACIWLPLYFSHEVTLRDNLFVILGLIMAGVGDSLHKMDKKGQT